MLQLAAGVGQIKFTSVLNSFRTMIRRTKKLTPSSSTSVATRSSEGDTGETIELPKSHKQARSMKLSSKTDNEIPKDSIMSKFNASERPKLTNKRSHLLVQYDKSSEVEIKEESQQIKVEPMELEVKVEDTILKIKQESDLNATPKIESETLKKKIKLHDMSNMKTDSKHSQNWEEMLKNIRQMRKEYNAPVDTMGCDMCMDKTSSPKDARYQALISLMLSSQTKDNVTFAAMQRLNAYGCTVDKILDISDDKLSELIYPVGFWKKKVQYIKESTKMLKDEFDGDIPKTVEGLCKLKGVGPKMAHLCMKTAWDEITGIGVDTHVHRISNRMGWVQSKNPEGTRKQLEDLLPQDLWKEANHLMVGFGQQICLPVKPQCATCLNYTICPFGISQLKKK